MNKIIKLKDKATVGELKKCLDSLNDNQKIYVCGDLSPICINVISNRNTVSIDTVPEAYIDEDEVIISINYGSFFLALWNSCNDVDEESENCDAVIGYSIYDIDGNEIDGGEIDYDSTKQYLGGLFEAANDVWDIHGIDKNVVFERVYNYSRSDESLYQIVEK